MIEEPAVHALDYLHILRRRKRWVLIPLALSIVWGSAAAGAPQGLPSQPRRSPSPCPWSFRTTSTPLDRQTTRNGCARCRNSS